MIRTSHKNQDHPEYRAPRPRKVARLKQLNKSNRILRRHYAGVRHRVLTAPAAAAAVAA
jgi:hypothetical protein